MYKKTLILTALLVALFFSSISGKEKMRLAILELKSKDISQATAARATEWFRTEMINTGKFIVIERSAMNEILKEQAFQMSGCTDTSCAVQVGKLLSVRKILIGSIEIWRKKIIVNARIIDVEKGIADCAHKEVIESLDNLDDGIALFARNLTQRIEGLPIIAGEKSNNTKGIMQATKAGLVAWYPFNGNANDMSGNNNHGKVFGAKLTNDRFGKSENAYYFDGKNDYIEIQNSESLNPQKKLTIALWIKIDKTTNIWSPILHKGGNLSKDSANRQYSIWLYNILSVDAGIAGDESGQHFVQTGAGFISRDEWTFIVLIADRENHKIEFYKNGIIYKKFDDKYNNFNINKSNLRIGWTEEEFKECSPFNGAIDDIRIYSTALSGTEIQTLYKEGKWEGD